MLKYYLTDESDEPSLRKLLREIPMRGTYDIALQCEPNYLQAAQVQGNMTQTFGMKDTEKNELVGMGTRAIKTSYVNGKPKEIGYLSGLRGKHQYRSGLGLIRGYQLLKQYHEDNKTKLYLSTIIEDNSQARTILEAGRCGMPAYHDLGRFCSYAISLKQRIKNKARRGIVIRQAKQKDIPEIVTFLRKEGSKKQFFPEYKQEDILSDNGILHGLEINDIFLAIIGDELVGLAAAWNQKLFKQSVVVGYKPVIRNFRPIINAALSLLGYPVLPKQNEALNYFNLALVCIKNNDKHIFIALLNTITEKYKKQHSFMMAGMHERDPLLSVLKKYKAIPYSSRLYVVCWEDGENEFALLDDRVPYLELGAL